MRLLNLKFVFWIQIKNPVKAAVEKIGKYLINKIMNYYSFMNIPVKSFHSTFVVSSKFHQV